MSDSNPPPASEGAYDIPLHRKIAWAARELWEKYGRPEGRDRQLWRAAKRMVCREGSWNDGMGAGTGSRRMRA
jgi:hypothetical protein